MIGMLGDKILRTINVLIICNTNAVMINALCNYGHFKMSLLSIRSIWMKRSGKIAFWGNICALLEEKKKKR